MSPQTRRAAPDFPVVLEYGSRPPTSIVKNWSRAIAQFRAKLYKREIREKRGRNGEAADTIRSYMLGYRRRIQDHRSNAIIHDVDRVLDGDIADLMVGS